MIIYGHVIKLNELSIRLTSILLGKFPELHKDANRPQGNSKFVIKIEERSNIALPQKSNTAMLSRPLSKNKTFLLLR